MTRALRTATGLLLLGLSLAACHHNKSTAVVTPPTQPPAAFETQFGNNFALAFQASPNSEPRPTTVGDVIPVNPTAEPTALPK